VKLLLDTQVFLWSMWGRNLSSKATSAFLDPNNELYLSAASYWEICIKVSIGKLTLASNWPQKFAEEMVVNSIKWLPVEQTHCRKIIELPPLHGDPFDRLLIAQALCEGMTVLSADASFQQYPAAVLW
jgi:PIN domain nuclease of toxin-antitoxin system